MSAAIAYLESLDTHDRLVLAVVFGLLALFLTACAQILWMQRRANRELENEFLLRVGMDAAKRYRLLPLDYKSRLARFNEDTQ